MDSTEYELEQAKYLMQQYEAAASDGSKSDDGNPKPMLQRYEEEE